MGNEQQKGQAVESLRYRNRTLDPESEDYRQKYASVDAAINGGLSQAEHRQRQLEKLRLREREKQRKKANSSLLYEGVNNRTDDDIYKQSSASQRSYKKSVDEDHVKNRRNNFNSLGVSDQNVKNFLTVDVDSEKKSSAGQSRVGKVVSSQDRNKILEKLSKRNEELRRQLKQINDELTEKLKKKKFVPKKKGNNKNHENQSDSEDEHEKKQRETRNAGLKRELQNGYKQIDMYKRTLLELKGRSQTETSTNRIHEMENQIVSLDKMINETIKKIDGMKNIKRNQEKTLQKDINQDLIDEVELLRREEEEIKKKIKELNRRDTQRDNNLKRQQAYLFEVEKKLREINGQYFPELKKKAAGNSNNGQKNVDNKKGAGYSSTEGKEYPSNFEVKTVEDEMESLRLKHQEYHKKINNQLTVKNRHNDEIQGLDEEISRKQKTIQSLRSKLQEIKKIIRPTNKNLFGYDNGYDGQELSEQGGANISEIDKEIQNQQEQDQFDIKHLIANIPKPIRLKAVEMEPQKGNKGVKSGDDGNKARSEASGGGLLVTGEKSQPKVWGSQMTRKEEKGKHFKSQLSFDDSAQFESSQIQPLVIGVNVWVNKNSDILALQAIYLNKDEIRYGVKSSSSADGFIVRYDLQAPDYLKNINGSFSEKGLLEHLAFHSKKGKSMTFGNKREGQQDFTFGLASNERPFRFFGGTIMADSEPRIANLGVEICIES